jgi:hypothetical protein
MLASSPARRREHPVIEELRADLVPERPLRQQHVGIASEAMPVALTRDGASLAAGAMSSAHAHYHEDRRPQAQRFSKQAHLTLPRACGVMSAGGIRRRH